LFQPVIRKKEKLPEWTYPKELQRGVPYRNKPKFGPSNPQPSLDSKRVVVVREPEEEKASKLMRSIRYIRQDKQKKQLVKKKEERKEYRKKLERAEVKKLKREKNLKKRICKALGQEKKKNS
jgi:ribosome biogenesis protein BMS1